MFNIYDRCSNILLNEGRTNIEFKYNGEIQDFEAYIIVKIAVPIADVDRGWRGDLTFLFEGVDITGENEVTDCATLKDVLCSARQFNVDNEGPITWEYKFLKY